MRAVNTAILASALSFGGMTGCGPVAGTSAEPERQGRSGSVTFTRARCPDVQSCFLGHVITADTATPLSRAAVFLEREPRATADAPIRIQTLTDDQGVFMVKDAPAGRYRLAIYKDSACVEARGIELGAPGTAHISVRLPRLGHC
jgi:hypothetical protein